MPRRSVTQRPNSEGASQTVSHALSFAETFRSMLVSLAAGVPVGTFGSPGVGKTSLVAALGAQLGLPVHVLLASQADPTDLGGIPWVDRRTRTVERLPVGAIRKVCDGPGLLFLDEITLAPPAVLATVLRGVHEGVWGDSRLHPRSRVVLAANPPGEVPAASDLPPPLVNRVTWLTLVPRVVEVQSFFRALGTDGSRLRVRAAHFAAALDHSPALLQLAPPPGAVTAGRQWGSPRSWERACRNLAAADEAGEAEDSPIVRALVAGDVGEECATAYLAIRKIAARLPRIDEIVSDPETARLPVGVDASVALASVLVEVALRDASAAWVYAGRLADEVRLVAYKALLPFRLADDSPWRSAAERARAELIRTAGRALAGELFPEASA